VDFTTLANQILTGSDANGQAVLTAQDGSVLQDVMISLTPGQTNTTFKDLIFALDVNPNGTATSVTITAHGSETVEETFTISGSPFFTVLATDGQTISDVQITFIPDGTGVESLKQPRISGLTGVTPIVPEPSTM
jgi:hypothetical protein